MSRKHPNEKLESLYNTIEQQPGCKPGFLARLLGWQRSEVTRALPALEERGWLVSEDHKGGLWPFSEKKDRNS